MPLPGQPEVLGKYVLAPDTPLFQSLMNGRIIGKVPRLGHTMLAAKNDPAINHLMFAAGHQVPSPMWRSNYDWSYQTPFVSQKETAAMIVARRRSYVLNQMGTGKTWAALFALDWLLLHGYIRDALIIAPLSTLRHVWADTIYQRFHRLKPVILHSGMKAKRLEMLNLPGNVYIINHDGTKVIADELANFRFGAVVIDELAVLRNSHTKMWKAVSRIVHNVSFVTGMTGSPVPNAPSDCYGQIKLLQPEKMRLSFTNFRPTVEFKVGEMVWKPRYNAKDTVYALMQPATRFRRKDVFELKGLTVIPVTCDLSKDQEKFIEIIKRDLIAKYKEGLVTAANAAVLAGKLLQAYSGAVYTSDKGIVYLSPIDRLIQLDALIEAAEGKVIVFCSYRHIAALVSEKLAGPPFNRGEQIVTLDRALSQRRRYGTLADFQNANSKSRVLVSHPKLMAHGVTLTAADTIVWFGPHSSAETVQQAEARITRFGQEREQFIYHLRSSRTEDKVYGTNKDRGTMQETILNLFESNFMED